MTPLLPQEKVLDLYGRNVVDYARRYALPMMPDNQAFRAKVHIRGCNGCSLTLPRCLSAAVSPPECALAVKP